jgi:hypothetical protein
MKENSKIKRPSINKAIHENMIYQGYRWAYVDRELDPNIVYNIEPTKKTKPKNLGYIAKLDKEKSQILNVYIDRKTATELNNYKSPSALDIPVRDKKISNNNYYLLFDDCSEKLQDDFLEKHNLKRGELILYRNGVGQLNTDRQLIQEFICKYDCIRTLHISDRTLAKTLDKNIPYNNYYYVSLDSKLFI